MTDQELIRSLTEELAPRIREFCADDKMDCDELCDGNILTAKCIVFQAADRLAALMGENAKLREENDFRKQVSLTPIYTCGGHGYGDDDDEDFWCPVCHQHLGTHRGYETTCPRCGQAINSEPYPCWNYAELRRADQDHLPKNWEHGAKGEE